MECVEIITHLTFGFVPFESSFPSARSAPDPVTKAAEVEVAAEKVAPTAIVRVVVRTSEEAASYSREV